MRPSDHLFEERCLWRLNVLQHLYWRAEKLVGSTKYRSLWCERAFRSRVTDGKRVRWSSFERRPNGLGAARVSQNFVPSKVTSSFPRFITLHITVSEGFEPFLTFCSNTRQNRARDYATSQLFCLSCFRRMCSAARNVHERAKQEQTVSVSVIRASPMNLILLIERSAASALPLPQASFTKTGM
jgi:hypothetical protein